MNDVNKAMMPPTECTSVKIYYPVEIVFQFHQKPGQLLVFHFMLQDVDRGQLNEKIPNKNIINNNCVWDMISPKETITFRDGRWMVEYVKFPLKSLHTEFSVIMSNCNEILCNGRSVTISIKNCYQSRLWHQRWNLHNKIICIPQALSSYPSDEYYQALNCRQCKDPFLPFTLPRCVARILVSCKKAFPVSTESKVIE